MQHASHQARLSVVQALRGIAALLVVLVHTVSSALRTGTGFPPEQSPFAHRLIDLGASGVDIFFVISGFIMALVASSDPAVTAGRFLRDRLLRVVPYYWLATLLFLAVAAFGARDYLDEQLAAGLTLFPWPSAGRYETPVLLVGWTLAFELAFYGVVAFAIAIGTGAGKRLQLAMMAVLTLGLLGFVQVPDNNLLAVWRNPLWLEFLLGMLVFCAWRKWPVPALGAAGPALLGVGIAGLGITLLGWFDIDETAQGAFDDAQGILRLIAWALPASAILLGALWTAAHSNDLPVDSFRQAIWNWFLALGDASYSLYLLHLSIICVYEDAVPVGAVAWYLAIPVLLVANVVLAKFAFRYVEAPLLKFLRRTVRWPVLRLVSKPA